jgi:hypothetical protein
LLLFSVVSCKSGKPVGQQEGRRKIFKSDVIVESKAFDVSSSELVRSTIYYGECKNKL